MSVEKIKDGHDILAIIVRSTFSEPGLHFITPKEFNLQLGIHIRSAGDKIPPHTHKRIENILELPIQEFLFIEKGRIRVDLFNKDEDYHSTVELQAGDSILLLRGHYIEFLKDTKIIEIKQGPYYSKEHDKRPIREG